jgi:hypothetical protein
MTKPRRKARQTYENSSILADDKQFGKAPMHIVTEIVGKVKFILYFYNLLRVLSHIPQIGDAPTSLIGDAGAFPIYGICALLFTKKKMHSLIAKRTNKISKLTSYIVEEVYKIVKSTNILCRNPH